MDRFELIEQIGEEYYGFVYKAKERETGEKVVLKRIPIIQQEGFPGHLLREISILKDLKHENIVKLIEVIKSETNIVLVFEYFQLDLKKYMETRGKSIGSATTCFLFFQLMKGLKFCHNNNILHLDLKPANILIKDNGELKIGEFGHAKSFGVPFHYFTDEVITLWYRPPDLLFGATNYSTCINIWSAGCIFAELSSGGVPLFPGSDVDDQLRRIFMLLGTPTNHSWPGVQNLPKFKPFPVYPSNSNWTSLLPNLSDEGHDLISKLVVCNPAKRIRADAVLRHPYFIKEI